MDTWLGAAGKHLIVLFFLVTGVSNLTQARIADHIERMRPSACTGPGRLFWLGIALQFTGCALIELGWHPAIGVCA